MHDPLNFALFICMCVCLCVGMPLRAGAHGDQKGVLDCQELG